ncbi:MAG: hypothetical protein OXM87_03220 [Truepera sp.]|nr:hypothetical protein [Truepera sp.]
MQVTPSVVNLGRLQPVVLGLGIIGIVGAVIGLFISAEAFFQSYLFAFLFWLGLALGCLVLLLVVHVAGGSWGAVIRRPLEAGVSVLPLMALLFIPILLGVRSLYVWTGAEYLATHPTVANKVDLYLNIPFFISRAAAYFVMWVGGALIFLRLSSRQDAREAESGRIGYQMKSMAGIWIVIYILTMTFAAVDWSMSLTPTWWSGIYGVIMMIGQAITGMAFIILVMVALARRNRQVNELLTAKRLQDLGNFLMAFTMFWAYTSFSQLIILWSNNTLETASWYTLRLGPGWNSVAAFLLFFGFFAPFLILFSRWVKRKRQALTLVAIWALVVQAINLFWFIIPTFERSGFQLSILDVALFVGIGGLWLWTFARSLGSRSILPLHDPRLAGVKHHG